MGCTGPGKRTPYIEEVANQTVRRLGIDSELTRSWPGDSSDLQVFLLIYKVYCKIIIIIVL